MTMLAADDFGLVLSPRVQAVLPRPVYTAPDTLTTHARFPERSSISLAYWLVLREETKNRQNTPGTRQSSPSTDVYSRHKT